MPFANGGTLADHLTGVLQDSPLRSKAHDKIHHIKVNATHCAYVLKLLTFVVGVQVSNGMYRLDV